MIEKILRKFGVCPISDVDHAYREGRIDGEEDVMKMCRERIEMVRLQYSDIERHRDALIKMLVDREMMKPPAPIVIKNGASVSLGPATDE